MVVTNDYGTNSWALQVGTNIPGTDTEAGATMDAGNAIYLLCRPGDLHIQVDGQDKIKSMAGGYTYASRAGKRQFSVEGTGTLAKGSEGGASANVVENINHVLTWLVPRQEAADNVYYLVIRVDSKSVSFYAQTTQHFYLGVYCTQLRFSVDSAGHATCRFRFVEAWN
jgi:hypothetical protein